MFGPVVCVYTYDALDKAIGRANALPVAFQAAIFTRDYGTAMRAYTRLDASAVMLNDHTATAIFTFFPHCALITVHPVKSR